jgi:hypothetical protein
VATATEEIVRTEQEEYEADIGPEGARTGDVEPAEPKESLFDREAYKAPELRIDQVDGQEVDKIWIRFSGKVALDRTKPDDVALFNRARLGQELEIRVAGRGARVGTGYTTSKGGDLDAIVGERTIDVHTVYVLGPEELSE